MLYCTLSEAQLELATEVVNTTNTPSVDDRRLLSKIRAVSRRVDSMFPQPPQHWPFFAPTYGTRLERITPFKTNRRDGTLALGAYLLELTSDATIGSTSVTVEGYPDPNYAPFKRLRKTDCCLTWYDYCVECCDPPYHVSIPGLWGFHSDYAHAWTAVDALAAAITTTSATTFTVADADGVDAYGVAPRFSIGNLVRIDDEFMEVTGVNTTTNTITVLRGVNGSTAATHSISAAVATYQVEPAVKTAVARQAAFQYERRGAFVSVEVQGMGTEIRYPNDFLAEVYGNLQAFANE